MSVVTFLADHPRLAVLAVTFTVGGLVVGGGVLAALFGRGE